MVKRILEKIHTPFWLVLILALIFLFRIPTFFEPYHYGDEMIYLSLGEAIRRGLVLYLDIYDNKPPLLYFVAAMAGNVFWFRAILAGWMMFTTIIFAKLASALFPKNGLVVKIATFIFAILTTIPLLEGPIPNAELFMIAPTMTAFLILLTKKLNALNILLAGFLFSISALFKLPAVFDIGAIIFFWVISIKINHKNVISLSRNITILLAGFSAPILLTIIWYWSRGALNQYFSAVFIQNIGYLSSWRPADAAEPLLIRNGPLFVRGGILLSGLIFLLLFKKKVSKSFLFITAWLLFSLFAATLSERPYPHYLIQVVPAVSLLFGVLSAVQSVEQSLTTIPLLLVFLTILRYQFWYYPTITYYERFVSLITGRIGRQEYLESFNKNVKRNYKIAEFLITSSKKTDPIFVWGDSSSIYALSKRLPPLRFVADYHISDFSSQDEVLMNLKTERPKFVIILPEAPSFPNLLNFLQNGYVPMEDIEGASIWKSTNFVVPR